MKVKVSSYILKFKLRLTLLSVFVYYSCCSGIKGASGHQDLLEFVDKSKIECLNQSQHHTITGLLEDNDLYLESDADEQVSIYKVLLKIIKKIQKLLL